MSQQNLFNTTAFQTDGSPIRAKIMGIGGAGLSLVDGLRLDGFDAVRTVALDVDVAALSDSIASEKVALGRRLTRGMGTGGEPSLGRKAAEEDRTLIRKHLDGVDLIFLLAGLGGGTGGGVAPEVAKLARDAGALVFAFCPLPFSWEKQRHKLAEDALADLRKFANAVVPLPNDSLLQVGGPDASALECFAQAGRNVSCGISSICSLVFRKGMIDVDFAHIRKAFNLRSGRTLFGIGEGQGEDALRQALRDLLLCPMLHLPDVSRAADVLLITVTGSPGMSMAALQQVAAGIREEFKAGEHVVFGAHVDENMGDRVEICVLGATDLEAGAPVADVAPDAAPVLTASPKAAKRGRGAHTSKLKRAAKRKPR
ncbi:uncharacterized protein METZ01_LOCUS192848, partial [marine metagenome]